MDLTAIIIILVGLMVAITVLIVVLTSAAKRKFDSGLKNNSVVSTNLRALVSAQRQKQSAKDGSQMSSETKIKLAVAAAAESELSSKKPDYSSRYSIKKRLRYAHWPITEIQFRVIQAITTIALVIPAYLHATIFIQILALIITPLSVSSCLDFAVGKRFNQFDEDYPVLLMSYVSLLKTGMSTIGGLEAAAKGLDPGSLVRAEVELLIERLKLGLTEEQAIGAFGEDIPHPELELFVQSLILSRRVGGTLSQTLERLAKQVRKRQEFRKKAVAAVAMERGSIVMIAAIMTALMIYLSIAAQELVKPAFSSPLGLKIFQGGISLVIFGFYWSRKVTNIKV